MKSSFDGTTWYQFEWLDIEFRDFEKAIKDCNNISELSAKILDTYPNSEFKYLLIPEMEKKPMITEPKKKRKRK